jgi:hypothetical protein
MSTSTQKDFSNFKDNNSKKMEENNVLNKFGEKGGAIWANLRGNICIRTSPSAPYQELTVTKAENILTILLGMPIKIETKKSFDEIKNKDNTIHLSELLLVVGEEFNTNELQEFYEQDGSWHINLFKPSKYLMLSAGHYNYPTATLKLVEHLVNYDSQRNWYFLNWLAAFFQTLNKSQVSILFKGVQGAGKGTFFKIIRLLFGEDYCKEINGDSLKSNYLGGAIENTLFINFDEISYSTIGKSSFNSFLKALITNDSITAEKKNVDLVRPTKLYAQTILFSNDEHPIEIEASDRRFTVFTTGCNLDKTNYLGYGSYQHLEDAIRDELEDFAIFLKSFNVNFEQANTALSTPEKVAMINMTANTLRDFVNAIIMKNFAYFQYLQNINIALFNIFTMDLQNNVIRQKYLIKVYKILYPLDKTICTSKTLIKHLEMIDPFLFGEPNLHKSNGEKFYRLSY